MSTLDTLSEELGARIRRAFRIADEESLAAIETNAVPFDLYGTPWLDARPMVDPREAPPEVVDMHRERIDHALERGFVVAHPAQPLWLRVTGKGRVVAQGAG